MSGFSLPVLVLLVSIHPLSLSVAQRSSPLEPLKITVRVYNYAGIDSKRLERAQKGASVIFIKAGVEINWLSCACREAERQAHPDCMSELSITDVILKLMPRIDLRELGFKKSVFGLSAGRNVIISCERLEEVAVNSEQICDKLLGLVMAHEVGHVLLGTNSHSNRGIMRPQWDSGDLRRESRQTALFTEEQARQMHQILLARK